MKQSFLLILLLYSLCAYCQFNESFADGDYTQNPEWVGTYENFAVNPWKQLQTKADEATTSYLSTPCRVNALAEWSFWCRIACEPTAYNYMRIYIMSTTQNPAIGDGLYVQIGGSDKNITLCRQRGNTHTLLIANNQRKQILSAADSKVQVRILLDEKKNIHFYSKVIGIDSDYVLEGSSRIAGTQNSEWFSILVKNTKQTGNCYYADDISVQGFIAAAEDITLANGNLIINEIMFNPEQGGQEYIEIYNKDSVAADLSYISFTTKNADGEYRTPNKFPASSYVDANDYAVLCRDADSLIYFHSIERSDNIFDCNWTRKLPNEGTTIYLLQSIEDSDSIMVLDSVGYSPKWHHKLLDETKGVSLEKINPYLEGYESSSWHSAGADKDYATPGIQNSQYREMDRGANHNDKHCVWLEDASFSPNGDGWKDVCLIHYALPQEGYAANLRVFTPKGVLIAFPEKNAITSAEGTFIWDGTLLNNSVAPVGAYVLQCEFINTATGKTLKERLPVVVSAR